MKFIQLKKLGTIVFLLTLTSWASADRDSLERHLALIVTEETISQTLSQSEAWWIQGTSNSGFLRVPFKHRFENHGVNFGVNLNLNSQLQGLAYIQLSRANLRENSLYQTHCHGGIGIKLSQDKWESKLLGYYGEGNANLLGFFGQISYQQGWRNITLVPKFGIDLQYVRFHGVTTGITFKPALEIRYPASEFTSIFGTLTAKLRCYSRQGEIANFVLQYRLGWEGEITKALKWQIEGEIEHGGGVVTSLQGGLKYYF